VASHEIVTLPSASSLAALRRGTRAAAPKLIAVVADPVFGADDPRVSRRSAASSAAAATGSATSSRAWATRALEPFVSDASDGTRASLARLPFSRAEALAVSSQVPKASLLQATDFDATLALATSGRLSDYRIVHFATHGLINTMRPELSGLALSLVDREGRTQDGFLRLNTIYNLRLSADLVVLSACQTALGKEVAGEGLVGLTRGFMYAGSRRVIASLWQVSDVATAELMKKFYTAMLQQGLLPAAALRRAQLQMAADVRWASPYFWAGFVLQGDWQQ
jgi:CHAT domain-containing protein